MADITWTDVTNHAPQLTAVKLGARTDILAYVNESFAASKFGGEEHPKYKMFRILVASHMGQLEKNRDGETSSNIASKSISRDSMSVSFANATSAEGLQATSYGREAYAMVISSPAARMPIVP